MMTFLFIDKIFYLHLQRMVSTMWHRMFHNYLNLFHFDDFVLSSQYCVQLLEMKSSPMYHFLKYLIFAINFVFNVRSRIVSEFNTVDVIPQDLSVDLFLEAIFFRLYSTRFGSTLPIRSFFH